eukprot:CAMPEP_0203794104 /NCGR_PEP_ID=MMETSP0100_2-20121128/6286_1 /ASSEMBLY_ACC=CAM_ASM_000210 /TAXON_ID=96639 /ORGANISM=" , Strain NY0313808BC1" /LENGTH=327 /DNA_ID=CAMNT_0050698059 /DNA_START=473 /DNA_END=1453 /DNA_ORIENTATION=-
MGSDKQNVLVVGATGRIGSEVCKALTASGKFNVYGTTRRVPSARLEKSGVTAVKFAFGDKASAINAIKVSNATSVFFVTDYFVAAKGKGEIEVEQGKILVDACKECNIEHVVFSSVADCDKVPENVEHFRTKWEVEKYLKATRLSYSILRPTAFLENLHDPANWNPLTKGSVKGLWPHDLKLKMVSCHDIGKAAAAMIENPKAWQDKTLDCVSCCVTGDQLAVALSEASGVRSTYSVAVPRFAQYFFMNDLYNMVSYFENPGYSSPLEPFRKAVPDAMGPKEFFTYLGKWGDGEKFAARKDGKLLSPPTNKFVYVVPIVAAVAGAVF